ncbi:DUF6286 domain-containing protein [Compostimonas suwonensis]|uniref:Alkaline shock family protein YloU n=1 Tax=Compostimonas suwonensis TaxID=1048394 RepID=A0A2M9C0D4_9MICO|nr:DUF6286 domain-containing protein [Compostimonas suwonensis]PJJ63806.1 hypothetical protein CLV54_1482 [Compostimonas suwonensis]
MSAHPIYARVTRRETRSPRSVLAITLAVILIVVFVWVGTEIVLALLGQPALLAAPADMFASALGVGDLPGGIVATAGIVVAALGLVLTIAALTQGRRARHVLGTERAATVVDNEVIASALARHASSAGNVDPDNTTVSVSHRRAVVYLTPTSGIPVNRDAVSEAVTQQLASYGLHPTVRARVRISEKAKVGA